MNRKLFATLTTLVIVGFIVDAAQADVFQTNGTGGGFWDAASTWTRTSGSSNNYPQSGDTATVLLNDTVTLRQSEVCNVLTIQRDAVVSNPGAYVLTIAGTSGLTIDPIGAGSAAGLLHVSGAGRVDLTGGAGTNTINGEMRLDNASAELRITSPNNTVILSGSGMVKGTVSGAKVKINQSVTFDNRCTIQGILEITKVALATSTTFVNGSGGLVHANVSGLLRINPDALGAGAGDWQVSTSASAILRFSVGNASQSGDVTVSNGTLDVQADFTTSGDLYLSGNGTTISVSAGKTFQAS